MEKDARQFTLSIWLNGNITSMEEKAILTELTLRFKESLLQKIAIPQQYGTLTITDELHYQTGLTKLKYVFFFSPDFERLLSKEKSATHQT